MIISSTFLCELLFCVNSCFVWTFVLCEQLFCVNSCFVWTVVFTTDTKKDFQISGWTDTNNETIKNTNVKSEINKVNTKSTIQYPFEFCSDVSFIDTIFSRNWHLLFVSTLLISDLTFVFLLLSLLVSVPPDISKIFSSYHVWKQLFTQNNCSHKTTVYTKQLFTQKCATNYQTYLENQMNNFWTWNNSMLTLRLPD